MTKSGEMLDCLTNSVLIVYRDINDTSSVGAHIYEDQGNSPKLQVLQQQLFHSESQNGYAIYTALDHPPHRGLYSFGIVDGRREQNFVVVLNCKIFEGLYDFGKERIGDF